MKLSLHKIFAYKTLVCDELQSGIRFSKATYTQERNICTWRVAGRTSKTWLNKQVVEVDIWSSKHVLVTHVGSKIRNKKRMCKVAHSN